MKRTLTKRQWELLGRVFEREINGALYQSRRGRAYDDLADDGLVVHTELTLGADRFGPIRVEGWALTERGRLLYCAHCDVFAPRAVEVTDGR